MKKILAATFALFVLAGAANAQTTEGKHHKGGHEKMAAQLNLTADQQTQLKAIHEAEKKEMQSLKTGSLSADQSKAQRKAIHDKYRQQSMAVYTPAQKDQLEKMKAEWKAKAGKKGEGRKGTHAKGARADFMKDLNLTADQRSKMEQLRNENKGQYEAVRNDKSLSDDQKKAKMKELRTAQHDKMKQILTPEQLEKMKSLRNNRPQKNTK